MTHDLIDNVFKKAVPEGVYSHLDTIILSLERRCTLTVSLSVHQTLQREVEGHQPRVDEVLERGRRMAAAASAEGRPEAERIANQLKELEEAWARLQDEMAKRRERLNGSNLAQQYYNDADEAEAWIGEQELYMIADEKAKVRSRARAARDRRGSRMINSGKWPLMSETQILLSKSKQGISCCANNKWHCMH